jgi:hypothetical protein
MITYDLRRGSVALRWGVKVACHMQADAVAAAVTGRESLIFEG